MLDVTVERASDIMRNDPFSKLQLERWPHEAFREFADPSVEYEFLHILRLLAKRNT